jgi:hypothetical protein
MVKQGSTALSTEKLPFANLSLAKLASEFMNFATSPHQSNYTGHPDVKQIFCRTASCGGHLYIGRRASPPSGKCDEKKQG